MNTVMITGTAHPIGHKVDYHINIWGSLEGSQLEFITSINIQTNGYNTLWQLAKESAVNYFSEPLLQDGAYTQYLDHLIMI